MYVINPEEQDMSKLYECNGIVANWLIYEKKISQYGKSKDGNKYYFVKTELLNKAIEEMPFYYRVAFHLP